MRNLRKWLLLIAFAPAPAFAQACGTLFNDVPPTHPFCDDIEWIRNRGVTTGCIAMPPQYCPDQIVNRGQMAAFMKRLGRVLTPTILRAQNANADGTYDPLLVTCQTAPLLPPPPPIPGYPRQASFAATIWNYNASAPKYVNAELVYSFDGVNWLPTGDFAMSHNLQIGQHATLAVVGGPLDLLVGPTYHFALRLITLQPTATIEGECQLNVRIDNRTGTSSPLDPIQ